MNTIPIHDKHSRDLLEKIKTLYTKTKLNCLFALLDLFLKTSSRTTFQNLEEVSPSTASRFFANHTNKMFREFASTLSEWQLSILWLLYSNANRRGRRAHIALKVDLTSIEKTGVKLPFVFLFNKIFGIHIIVLHAHVGHVSCPLAFRIYLGKGRTTQVKLALQMLKDFPPEMWPSRTVVLGDAGFGTKELIRGCKKLGFDRTIVGIRKDRKLTTGQQVCEVKRGARVRLHDMREIELTVSSARIRRDGEYKMYYTVSTFKASGKWLRKRYRMRWLIETFFQSVKHDFGLKETRLRTEIGIKMWIYYTFLAYSLAMLERAKEGLKTDIRYKLTMEKAARQIAEILIGEWILATKEKECERLRERIHFREQLSEQGLSGVLI